MRGKPAIITAVSDWTGITPADAGKTHTGYNLLAKRAGSPPRMRGKPGLSANEYMETGITPADAGKTRAVQPPEQLPWDHPRGCGENWDIAFLTMLGKGSPPRMRGKRAQAPAAAAAAGITPADAGKPTTPRCRIWGIGITPADAGKTNLRWATYSEQKDHPRGCGENQELPGVAGG